jgi:predicted acylesterase/phospholipase RssA
LAIGGGTLAITILQKSDLSKPRKNPRVALILAGGAISGGAFKLGGLIALNRYLQGRSVNEFDMYICLSAGAFIGSCFGSWNPTGRAFEGFGWHFEEDGPF